MNSVSSKVGCLLKHTAEQSVTVRRCVGRDLFSDKRKPCRHPAEYAVLEFDNFIAVASEDANGLFAAVAAAAVEGDGFVFGECGERLLFETAAQHVDVDASLYVPFGIFLGGAYIKTDNIVLGDDLGKGFGRNGLGAFGRLAGEKRGEKHGNVYEKLFNHELKGLSVGRKDSAFEKVGKRRGKRSGGGRWFKKT